MVQILRENLELDTQLARQDGDVFSGYGIIQSLVCEQLLRTSSLFYFCCVIQFSAINCITIKSSCLLQSLSFGKLLTREMHQGCLYLHELWLLS